MRHLSVLLAAAAGAILPPLSAQILPGHSVVTVGVGLAAPFSGEMYDINHDTRTATQLTLSAALTAERVNCVLMSTGALGYVGTNPPVVAPGNIYRITIAGGVVAETLVNTTPTAGPNVAQMAFVGTNIYFVTQNASNVGAILQHVPAAGGAVVTDLDLTTVTNWNGLGNSCCAIGRDVYVSGFFSSTEVTSGALLKWDTTTSTATIVLQLPKSKLGSTTPLNAGPIWMIEHPDNLGKLVLCGVYGDVIVVDPVTATVVSHDFSGFNTSPTVGLSNLLNSFAYDPRTRDFIMGSRDAAVERVASGHSAEKVIINVGTTTNGSVNGMHHFPAARGIDYTTGPGCPGPGGYTLTSADTGLPTAGNAAFRFACYSGFGGAACALIVGTTNPLIDLAVIGYPGCILRASPTVVISTTLSGTGNGTGQASIPFPIPATAVGATIYHQWVQASLSPTVVLTVSNGRQLTVQ